MIIEQTEYRVPSGTLLLRNAETDDAEMLIEYLKQTAAETPFLANEPDEISLTVEQEQNYIESINKSEANIMLLGFLNGEYVGNCCFNSSSRLRLCHRATLGIALYEKYTGIGIGTVMIEKCFDIAKKAGFEQMELEVASKNERAIGLYKKLGFEVCGKIPDATKYKDGTYDDLLIMVRKL